MGRIDWIPIEELPEAFKDGRWVLLWLRFSKARVERWVNGRWTNGADNPTHFAEINAPAA